MKPIGDRVLACPNGCSTGTPNMVTVCPRCGEPMSWVQPHLHEYGELHIDADRLMVLEQVSDAFDGILDELDRISRRLSTAFLKEAGVYLKARLAMHSRTSVRFFAATTVITMLDTV